MTDETTLTLDEARRAVEIALCRRGCSYPLIDAEIEVVISIVLSQRKPETPQMTDAEAEAVLQRLDDTLQASANPTEEKLPRLWAEADNEGRVRLLEQHPEWFEIEGLRTRERWIYFKGQSVHVAAIFFNKYSLSHPDSSPDSSKAKRFTSDQHVRIVAAAAKMKRREVQP